ncbi:MAG TPA: MarR family transcriptional regulator [Firmicutes bacterium]|nr:MarR family transcriptional regulator [Bacillota bacterium]
MNDNHSSLGRQISILYRYCQCFISKELETYNIGSGQYIFLLALHRNDGISQEELSAYVKTDKATTAKAVKKLIESGYIYRDIDPKDKRAYKVFLTAKARSVIPVIQEAVKHWENAVRSGLTEDEKKLIEVLLHKMALNACQTK